LQFKQQQNANNTASWSYSVMSSFRPTVSHVVFTVSQKSKPLHVW